MNPAFSVVMLTTASGAGYGMLFWLGVLSAAGAMPADRWFGIPAVLVALALATAGLLASTLHLGRPERAWRAISQWRTSWLSREGVVSLVTYLPAIGFAIAWGVAGPHSTAAIVLGLVAAFCGMLTVFCQAMIYASLKPVRQWHNRFVAPNLLLLALASGAACLAAMAVFWLAGAGRIAAALAVVFSLGALAAKLGYWRFIDNAAPPQPSKAPRGSVPSARCANWKRRTPRRITCCATWDIGSGASMGSGCGPLRWVPASSRRWCC